MSHLSLNIHTLYLIEKQGWKLPAVNVAINIKTPKRLLVKLSRGNWLTQVYMGQWPLKQCVHVCMCVCMCVRINAEYNNRLLFLTVLGISSLQKYSQKL